jgi:hypothetical protein
MLNVDCIITKCVGLFLSAPRAFSSCCQGHKVRSKETRQVTACLPYFLDRHIYACFDFKVIYQNYNCPQLYGLSKC